MAMAIPLKLYASALWTDQRLFYKPPNRRRWSDECWGSMRQDMLIVTLPTRS